MKKQKKNNIIFVLASNTERMPCSFYIFFRLRSFSLELKLKNEMKRNVMKKRNTCVCRRCRVFFVLRKIIRFHFTSFKINCNLSLQNYKKASTQYIKTTHTIRPIPTRFVQFFFFNLSQNTTFCFLQIQKKIE